MRRTRVKVCGITRFEDAVSAIEAGADALGFVFYPASPRYVTPEAAAHIINRLAPFITTVGLFVNAGHDEVAEIIDLTGIDLLQFHGDENEQFCSAFSRPYIKALRVGGDKNPEHEIERFPTARAVLLDTYRKGVPGGTGEVFDWDLVPEKRHKPIILAGGLRPQNVGSAIKRVRPFAVDVSGGVEAQAGVKDVNKILAFIREVASV